MGSIKECRGRLQNCPINAQETCKVPPAPRQLPKGPWSSAARCATPGRSARTAALPARQFQTSAKLAGSSKVKISVQTLVFGAVIIGNRGCSPRERASSTTRCPCRAARAPCRPCGTPCKVVLGPVDRSRFGGDAHCENRRAKLSMGAP